MVALQVFVSSNDHHAMPKKPKKKKQNKTKQTNKQTNKQTQGWS